MAGMIRSVTLTLLLSFLPIAAQVELTQKPGRISVQIDGKAFSDFFYGQDTPKPYLHPLRTASGIQVTRGFPMDKVAGETSDHPHHRGLWFTHGDVNGIDFWMNEANDSRPNVGKVALDKIISVKSGVSSGSIEASFNWMGPDKKTLVAESRTMVFHADPKLRIVDVDVTLTAVEKAKFGDTKEGTFAVRVASGLEVPGKGVPVTPARTGKMMDSEGREGESSVWGKRAGWVDVYGEVEGKPVGIAIMDHPSNPHYPTFWHCRAYGLCAANIFGAHDFMNDKTQDASITLAPGEKLRFRYRVVVHEGDPHTAGLSELYRAWTAGN
jgi:hypothetical protein